MKYISYYDSPIGRITLLAEDGALTGLWFDESEEKITSLVNMRTDAKELKLKRYGKTHGKVSAEKHAPRGDRNINSQVLKETKLWLDEYFKGKMPDFMPKLSFGNATDFRKRVWNILLEIPFGQTVTYGDLAKRIAKEDGIEKMSAQAIGGAVGHNPISIIVPCHRVIGAEGRLTGYAGGLDKKMILLMMEEGEVAL